MIGRVEPVGAALNRDGVQAAVGNAGGRLAFSTAAAGSTRSPEEA